MCEINYILCESSKYKYLYQGSAEMDHFSLRSGQFFKKVLFESQVPKFELFVLFYEKCLEFWEREKMLRHKYRSMYQVILNAVKLAKFPLYEISLANL